MRPLKLKWHREGKGIRVGPGGTDFLQNLRFADDLLLIATSKSQVEAMLKDLRSQAGAVGLELHMGKTKILSNGIGPATRRTEADIDGQKVEVLSPTDSTMYLGRALSLRNTHETEINHRITRAWCKFGQYKKELMSKAYPLSDRLRLFNAVVTPTVLYGSGAWVITKTREQKPRAAQRRMIPIIPKIQ